MGGHHVDELLLERRGGWSRRRPDAIVGGDPTNAAGLTQIVAETATEFLGMRVDLARSRGLTRSMPPPGGAATRAQSKVCWRRGGQPTRASILRGRLLRPCERRRGARGLIASIEVVPARRFAGLLTLVVAGVLAVAVPVMAGNYRPSKTEANGVYDGLSSSHPGNAANGKKVFIADCGRCHAMKAAKTTGTVGPNLSSDAVSYTNVVNAVVQGVGGIQAEYVIIKAYSTMSQAQRDEVRKGSRVMTFSELYDVAKFVTTARS